MTMTDQDLLRLVFIKKNSLQQIIVYHIYDTCDIDHQILYFQFLDLRIIVH